MKLSNELKAYMEEHKEGLVLREVPDEILFEMLSKATECEANGKKGTAAFQDYFKLDMSYTTALKEPEARGYRRLWVKGDEAYETETGKRVEEQLKAAEEEFTIGDYFKLMFGKGREVQRLYVRAYPETVELLKELADRFPRGAKGRMEAQILSDALAKVEGKYRAAAKVIDEL